MECEKNGLALIWFRWGRWERHKNGSGSLFPAVNSREVDRLRKRQVGREGGCNKRPFPGQKNDGRGLFVLFSRKWTTANKHLHIYRKKLNSTKKILQFFWDETAKLRIWFLFPTSQNPDWLSRIKNCFSHFLTLWMRPPCLRPPRP